MTESFDEFNFRLGGEVHHSLRAGTPQSTGVMVKGKVRRLSPLECERLMGWPDGYTLYGLDDDGTTITLPKSARYRICGNGIVAPITEWIAGRIMAVSQS